MFIVSHLKKSPGLKKGLNAARQKPLSDPPFASSLLSGGRGGFLVKQAGALPLAPLAPVLRCEVKAFWIYAQVSLLHRSFMPIHNVL